MLPQRPCGFCFPWRSPTDRKSLKMEVEYDAVFARIESLDGRIKNKPENLIPRIGLASHWIFTNLLRENIFSKYALQMSFKLRNGNTAINYSKTLNDETLPTCRRKSGSKNLCILMRNVSQHFSTKTPNKQHLNRSSCSPSTRTAC